MIVDRGKQDVVLKDKTMFYVRVRHLEMYLTCYGMRDSDLTQLTPLNVLF